MRFENLQKCSPHAECRGDNKGVRRCICRAGFEGNGFNCRLIVPTTPKPFDPCKVPRVCGRGAICRNNNGKAVCYCRNQVIPKNNACCDRSYHAR